MKALILSHALGSAYAADSKDDWTALGRTGAFRHVETPGGGFIVCVRSTTGRRPHFLDPTGLIRGLADLGVTHIATTAVCGSLSKWRKTPYILLVDQFLDFHRSVPDLGLDQDFFDISVPYCPAIRKVSPGSAKGRAPKYSTGGVTWGSTDLIRDRS